MPPELSAATLMVATVDTVGARAPAVMAAAAQALAGVTLALHFGDGSQGVRVVGGKCRVERLWIGEQASRTGQVREVARPLAGEHRVVRRPRSCAILISASQ